VNIQKGYGRMNANILKGEPQVKQSMCIWMQAGVVKHKHCQLDYDCPACHFDKVMQQIAFENKKIVRAGGSPKGRRGRIEFWKDKLRKLTRSRQPCLHHMKGRIDFRSCTNDYHCGNCDFDQYFNDQYTIHTTVRPVDVLDIHGVKAPQGYYLHRGHAWAKIEEGKSVRIGIDDFALRMLGPLDRIDMPLIGKEVKQGQPGIILHRSGHAANVLSPVSGVVTANNTRVNENGHLANQDPYTKGWVLQVHARNLRHDLKNLMIKDETQDFLYEEIDRLYEVIEDTAGPLAADGGQLGDDIFGNLPALGWEQLSRLFLLT
jgi:glycine cleavage system H lipoate-binding protein